MRPPVFLLASIFSMTALGEPEIFDVHKKVIMKEMTSNFSCPAEMVEITCLSETNEIGGFYTFSKFCFDIGVKACGNRFNYQGIGSAFVRSEERIASEDGYKVKMGKLSAVAMIAHHAALEKEAEKKKEDEQQKKESDSYRYNNQRLYGY